MFVIVSSWQTSKPPKVQSTSKYSYVARYTAKCLGAVVSVCVRVCVRVRAWVGVRACVW